jgi:hypothetical protein
MTLPGGQGARVRARVARDGTRWCIGCDWTLLPTGRDTMCRSCALARKAFLERSRREQAHVPVTLENAKAMSEAAQAVQNAAFSLLANEQDGYVGSDRIFALTRACKALTVTVENGLDEPLTRVLQRNQRAPEQQR